MSILASPILSSPMPSVTPATHDVARSTVESVPQQPLFDLLKDIRPLLANPLACIKLGELARTETYCKLAPDSRVQWLIDSLFCNEDESLLRTLVPDSQACENAIKILRCFAKRTLPVNSSQPAQFPQEVKRLPRDELEKLPERVQSFLGLEVREDKVVYTDVWSALRSYLAARPADERAASILGSQKLVFTLAFCCVLLIPASMYFLPAGQSSPSAVSTLPPRQSDLQPSKSIQLQVKGRSFFDLDFDTYKSLESKKSEILRPMEWKLDPVEEKSVSHGWFEYTSAKEDRKSEKGDLLPTVHHLSSRFYPTTIEVTSPMKGRILLYISAIEGAPDQSVQTLEFNFTSADEVQTIADEVRKVKLRGRELPLVTDSYFTIVAIVSSKETVKRNFGPIKVTLNP